ncbi:MAG: TfoX/Sxy family protein [Methanoregulaceae archaeon]|nr:TfoX/Sxy family protein [Methanoregulaceae archaeon]
MAITAEYRAHVEERLGVVAPITTKSMFGGLGIYSNGLFFALADDGHLYFKVDDTNRGDFEAAGTGPFFPWDGAKPMGYYELPDGLLDHPTDLAVWIDKALGVAERAALEKKRR